MHAHLFHNRYLHAAIFLVLATHSQAFDGGPQILRRGKERLLWCYLPAIQRTNSVVREPVFNAAAAERMATRSYGEGLLEHTFADAAFPFLN